MKKIIVLLALAFAVAGAVSVISVHPQAGGADLDGGGTTKPLLP